MMHMCFVLQYETLVAVAHPCLVLHCLKEETAPRDKKRRHSL